MWPSLDSAVNCEWPGALQGTRGRRLEKHVRRGWFGKVHAEFRGHGSGELGISEVSSSFLWRFEIITWQLACSFLHLFPCFVLLISILQSFDGVFKRQFGASADLFQSQWGVRQCFYDASDLISKSGFASILQKSQCTVLQLYRPISRSLFSYCFFRHSYTADQTTSHARFPRNTKWESDYVGRYCGFDLKI